MKVVFKFDGQADIAIKGTVEVMDLDGNRLLSETIDEAVNLDIKDNDLIDTAMESVTINFRYEFDGIIQRLRKEANVKNLDI